MHPKYQQANQLSREVIGAAIDLFKHASYSLFEDSQGKIWFSGGAIKGEKAPKRGISNLNRFDPAAGLENMLTARKQFEVKGGRGIFGLTEDKDGNIWFGTGRGIGQIDGDTVRTIDPTGGKCALARARVAPRHLQSNCNID